MSDGRFSFVESQRPEPMVVMEVRNENPPNERSSNTMTWSNFPGEPGLSLMAALSPA